jgi:hypothetical protein
MKDDLEEIAFKLTEIGKELNRKFGTDSYQVRCELHDIREELIKLSQGDELDSETNK